MALTDAIVASIEAELEALKEEAAPVVVEPAPAPVVEVPVVVEPTPAPVRATNDNPILQMAIDQAAERLARETAK
jgi:ribosome-associated translation inhibitor RaiA